MFGRVGGMGRDRRVPGAGLKICWKGVVSTRDGLIFTKGLISGLRCTILREMLTFKQVVFDYNGVLVDSEPIDDCGLY